MATLTHNIKQFIVIAMIAVFTTVALVAVSATIADDADARQARCFYSGQKKHFGVTSRHVVTYNGALGAPYAGYYSYGHAGYRYVTGNSVDSQFYPYTRRC